MIVEVNDAGEVLIPAELVQAPPHTHLEADRVVLRPIAQTEVQTKYRVIDSLPILEGQLTDPAITCRREEIYDADGR